MKHGKWRSKSRSKSKSKSKPKWKGSLRFLSLLLAFSMILTVFSGGASEAYAQSAVTDAETSEEESGSPEEEVQAISEEEEEDQEVEAESVLETSDDETANSNSEETESQVTETETETTEEAADEAEETTPASESAAAESSGEEAAEESESEEEELALELSAEGTISYQTYVTGSGWQDSVSDGATSGTTGQSLALKGLSVSLPEGTSGGVSITGHYSTLGWKSGTSDGTSAQILYTSYDLQAVTIELTGEIAEEYDIYYRVHSAKFGWLDWARNGEEAGTTGWGYAAQAIQIVLVEKDGEAPGSIGNACVPATPAFTQVDQLTTVRPEQWPMVTGIMGTGIPCM